MTLVIFKDLSKSYELNEGLPEGKFEGYNYLNYWLGRSCGARYSNTINDTPSTFTGIVVYPGLCWNPGIKDERHIAHVQTKNGPITVVCDLFRKEPKSDYENDEEDEE